MEVSNHTGAPAARLTGATTSQPLTESSFANDNTDSSLLADCPIFMTPSQVGDLLGMPSNSVRQLLREKEIEAVKIGSLWKIHRSWVEDFILKAGNHE